MKIISTRYPRIRASWSLSLSLLIVLSNNFHCHAYHHPRCTRKVSPQFQFEDCYLPPMDTSLLLSQASFVMSHDAATGYVKRGSLSASGLTWQYCKNQRGSVYRQLDDGARALDFRPKLLFNGTVIFQHGDINIPVTLEQVLDDAVRWSADNAEAKELVLLLPSNFAYQTSQTGYTDDDYYESDNDPLIVSTMSSIYKKYDVPYVHCSDVYGMTIAEILDLAALPTGGYMIAMDGQDYYGTPCAKPNWVEDQLVTCYSVYQNTTLLSCARQNPYKLADLELYMLASANDGATDDSTVLGPPADLSKYPLNQIQGLWQVTTASALTGMTRLSSILDDNTKSNVNFEIVSWIHGVGGDGSNNNENEDDGNNNSPWTFNAISVLAIDNVALNGNAILSVLRTACGQSTIEGECGAALAKPRMEYLHISKLAYHGLILLYVLVVGWLGVTLIFAILSFKKNKENPHPRQLWTIFQRLKEHFVPPPSMVGNDNNKKEELLS